MKTRFLFFLLSIGFCVTIVRKTNAQNLQQSKSEITFDKATPTSLFIAEGAAIADVNNDGHKDVISGSFWFEGPAWKPHALAKPDTFIVVGGYSNSFLNFAMDVNQDGWVDLIRIDWPGKAAVWHENPGKKSGYWPVHLIHESVGNESPQLVDMDGDGREDLLCNDPTAREVIWLKSPSGNGHNPWEKHVVSKDAANSTERYAHGLGVGDLNGDGRKDILVKNGWWEGPISPAAAGEWIFHPADLGEECSQMYVLDLNGDGLNDVISASAHKYGIWWHEQKKDDSGKSQWIHHIIDRSISQTHGLALADINGDGHPDIITGKRYFAHNGKDPGEFEPAYISWFEYKPGVEPTWTRHDIDANSGVGLQVQVEDINNDRLPDIVSSNKKGVHIFIQKKQKRKR